jgi:hypothetical protein
MGIPAAFKAYDELLRDPCAGNLTHPFYGGVESGYLIRTTDILTVTVPAFAGVVGAASTGNFAVSYNPSGYFDNGSYQAGIAAAGSTTGVAGRWAYAGVVNVNTYPTVVPYYSNFISSTVVDRFRPVAACLRWVPTGAAATRAGTVSLGYSQGFPVIGALSVANSGPLYNESGAYSSNQRYATNGAQVHEVRWLPTAPDEGFTNILDNKPSAGTVSVSGIAIDGVYSTTTSVRLSGYVEVTTVWEWTPTQASTNIVASPKAPPPYNTQQFLSTIDDMGAYLFEGVRSAASGAARGAVRGMTFAAMGLVNNGVRAMGNRGPGMLLTTA